MSFVCTICTLPFTGNGTKHALISTYCGHLIGKSCIEKWKNNKPIDKFSCPICCTKLEEKSYHPIYNFPDEFLNLTITSSEIQLPSKVTTKCLPINDQKDEGKLIKKNVKNIYWSTCTIATFNKCRKDVIEFCLGFEEGDLYHVIINLYFEILRERILIQESEKIYSICFLDKDKIAYSIGCGKVFVSNTFNSFNKIQWEIIDNFEKYNIKNLQKLTKHIFFGNVNGKLYAFEEHKSTKNGVLFFYYEDKYVTNYYIDQINGSIFIFCNEKKNLENGIMKSKLFIYQNVANILLKFYEEEIDILYKSYIPKGIPINYISLGVYFKSTFFVLNDTGYSCVYFFILNLEKNSIEVIIYSLNSTRYKKLLIYLNEFFENLNECIDIHVLNNPKIYLTRIIKIPICLFFKDKIVKFNFFSTIPEKYI
ncbi:Zinc finger, RING-type domain and Zinc finger, RING/FYVE/PHD-type domain-containing protein [Strongyloides ratti]|uniref:Zinc finger, RING-type domain and Zinc finger, RING/FYVE/PHD-type domain-containing protein n=1 Tax=Strongyloides ratti TaxID=34506 RepID=A0A090LA55_STRRB|nr:Zinc finger, RING-type domain and Zinc finger, RING/FYVE/PHD-type domain-containing protein [Strongyloides ratti]CEF66617.2 Zinc finger, RING-type domain and Zinc finger, RING/FYVE/PHD-type domain-containing protein [Strongyloides ratti]